MAFKKVTSFHFPGTSAGANPNVFRALGHNKKKSNSKGGRVRIYDATNGNEIARVEIKNTKVTKLGEDTTIQNLPSGSAIFEVQAEKFGNGNKFRLESVELREE